MRDPFAGMEGGTMGQVRNGSATTTRPSKQQYSDRKLSRELGIKTKTVAKWRRRAAVEHILLLETKAYEQWPSVNRRLLAERWGRLGKPVTSRIMQTNSPERCPRTTTQTFDGFQLSGPDSS